jgi:putative DNA methylase
MRFFWLCKKASRKRALRFQAKRQRERGKTPDAEFEIFEPKNERETPNGTVTRAKASCPACNMVLGPDRVCAQLAGQRGGADAIFDDEGQRTGGARLLAVVLLKPGDPGRHYRLPTERDYEEVLKSQSRVAEILDEWERGGKQGLCPVPDEPLPPIGTLGFRVQRYGMLQWGDLFTARQKLALVMLTQLASCVEDLHDREPAALAISKLSELACSICAWEPIAECTRHIFGR